MKNNIFKKLIASALCLSFMTLQTTFAQTVLENGYGGADISASHGGFTGVDKKDENNANLNFNGDAVLDWGHLNVGAGQSLNFINGNSAVLNNVLNGMSTIAGIISGGQGAIIISNPNGMLMAPGGSISTAGTLVLTTQDLVNKWTLDNGKLNINFNDAAFKDYTYNVIALNSGSVFSGGDLNIIAKGIDVKASNITSNGNLSFTTTDGANFIAASTDISKTNNIKFENGNSIQMANSSITSTNGEGTINLVTDKGAIDVKGTNFTAKNTKMTAKDSSLVVNNGYTSGDLTINARTVDLNKSTIGNDLTVDATDFYTNWRLNDETTVGGKLTSRTQRSTQLFNTKVTGDAEITSGLKPKAEGLKPT